MPSKPSSKDLLVHLEAGSKEALTEAYQRYFFRMVALLRKRLPGYLHRKVEPDDLAQSAWCSFLGGLAVGKLDLAGRDSLWPLLAMIATRKYLDLVERSNAQCRDVRRESSLENADQHGELNSPLNDLAVQETVDLLRTRLGDEKQQEILRLRLEGREIEEIGQEVELSTRTVKRVLAKVREIWEQVNQDTGS